MFVHAMWQAVDHPKLAHLRNVLVFSQQGHRPVPKEISGSDLDGDLYFVSWRDDLIPPSRRSYPPMDFPPAEAKNLGRVRPTGSASNYLANAVYKRVAMTSFLLLMKLAMTLSHLCRSLPPPLSLHPPLPGLLPTTFVFAYISNQIYTPAAWQCFIQYQFVVCTCSLWRWLMWQSSLWTTVVSDQLGVIANSHLALTDTSPKVTMMQSPLQQYDEVPPLVSWVPIIIPLMPLRQSANIAAYMLLTYTTRRGFEMRGACSWL